MPLEIHQLLHNRYRIKNIISQGGMGAVYYGIDENLGVEVAIKENLFLSDESSRQFHREATILASLRHPNLPRVTDHFILPDQGQYLIMDYIGGEDMKQLIKSGKKFSEEEVAKIGVVISDALSYLHTRTRPIIHRDIKPGNIKITPSNQIFLVDFGLARIILQDDHTATGAQALTPGFAPPEQYGQGTDPRSDIYSLGATLYNALTGKIPEDGLARVMGSAALTPVRHLNPALSNDLAQVIEKSLETSANLRYQTAESFKTALLNTNAAASFRQDYAPRTDPPVKGKISHNVSVENHIETTLQGSSPTRKISDQTPKTQPKKRFLPFLIGIAFLACIGSAAVIYFARDQLFPSQVTNTPQTELAIVLNETPEPDPTDTPAPTVAPSSTTEAVIPVTEIITPSLEPTIPAATPIGGASGQIALASDRSGIPQIWILDIDLQEYQQVTTLPDGACQPDWSPSGDRIVFVSPCREKMDVYKGSSLFTIRSDGTGFTPLPSMPGGDYDPKWSPDGKSIAFTSLRDGISHIYVINLDDNSVVRLSSPSSSDRSPEWSPDGESIAFMSTRLGVPQIWIMGKDGSAPHEFSNMENGAAFTPNWSPNGEILTFSQSSNLPWLVARQVGQYGAPEFQISDLRPAWDADFSEDGFWLIFESSQENNLDIYRMTLTGANLTQLTDDPANDFHPAWRPSISQ